MHDPSRRNRIRRRSAGPDPAATTYERLRRRGVLLAWLWAAFEGGRLVFASVALLFPWVFLVFAIFRAAERSIGHIFRMLGEWRLYAFLFAVSGVSFLLWRLAECGSQRLLQFQEDEPN